MSKFKALGCYIFAGGFTIGMKKHFKILGHLEDGDFGVESAKRNLNVEVWDQPEEWPLKQMKGKVNVVYCNPPCAPWSAAGKSSTNGGDNWKTDERVDCVRNCFNVLEEVQPEIWIWESVCRAFTGGKKLIEQLTKKANKIGYSATYFLTDASLHGLPQYRKRFHCIFHKVKLELEEPECKLVTAGDVLRKLPKSKEKQKISKATLKILKHTPQGRGLRGTFDAMHPNKKKVDGRFPGRPNFLKLRMHAKLPASTMTGGKNHFHPTEHRFITAQEAAALTGFPKWFKFTEGKEYAEIGKTVTPVMGEYLGRMFKRALKKNVKVKRPENVIVDFRKMCKRREMRKELGLIK